MTANIAMISKLQVWVLRFGIAWLGVCVIMTGAAGWSFGSGNVAKQVLFMFGFPLITIAAALILPFIEHAREKGAYTMAVLLVPAWIFCTVGEGFGHLMIIASQRDSSLQNAELQDTKYEDKRKSLRETEAKRTAILEAQKALEGSKGWTSSKTVDGWKSAIETARLAMDIESKKGGCKSKCLVERQKLEEAEANLAAAIKMEANNKQLAAIETSLVKMREEAKSDSKGHSDARSQTDVTAKLLTMSLRPGEDHKEWSSLMLELIFVAVFVIGPMTLIAIGVKDWDKVKAPRSGLLRNAFGRLKAWFNNEEYKPQDAMTTALARNGKVEINQTLTDNRDLPAAAKMIADLTSKYRTQVA